MSSEDKWPEGYERDKFYEEVWAEPVKIVAQRYGVFDVALAKTCPAAPRLPQQASPM